MKAELTVFADALGMGYMRQGEIRPQGFWPEQVSRFTGVRKQEQVWGGSREGVVLDGSYYNGYV